MTNKLPVVGKRYRLKNYKAEVINVDSEGVTYLQGDKEYWDFLDDFRDYFEELPEDKAETKPENQSHISESKEKMKQALDIIRNRKKYLDGYNNGFDDCLKEMAEQELPEDKAETKNTQKQFMSKEEEVKEKEESIWKSVSELPEDSYTVIIKAKGGYEEIFFGAYREDTQHFMDEAMKFVYPKKSIDKYCTLTDFINDYEKLKERDKLKEIKLRELEERVKKLEEK